jgi:hypothetical protein
MRFLLITLTAASVSLLGQSNDADAPKVSVKFRALAFDAPIIGSGYIEGQEARQLDISNRFLTGEQTYRGIPTISFVMVDDLTKPAPETPPEILAARSRGTAAQERARKASEEYMRLSALIDKANTGSREGQAGKISASELAEAAAAQARLSELSRIMAEANKEADDAQVEVNNRQRDHQQAITEAKNAKAGKSKAPTPPPAKAAASDKGKGPSVAPPPFATYTFPGDGKYILLFASAGNAKRIMAIEDKEGSFPFGSYLYINLTGKPVEVRYNGNSTPIAPNGRAVINAPVANDTYAQGEVLTPGEDGFQIGYIARTYQQADVRTLFFLLPSDAGGHSINIKGIEERKQPDPVPDPNAGAAKGGKAAAK